MSDQPEKSVVVLIIDDELQMRRLLRIMLEAHNYIVFEAKSGQEGLNQAAQCRPEIVILDLGLPDLDGVTVLKRLREWSQVPVVFLSVRDSESDKVAALDAGADDYVTKPFSPRELVARVKALLRRADPGAPSDKPIEIGVLRIDPAAYRVTRGGKPVPMSTLEFRLLYFLAARPNRVFTRDQLLDGVWGTERFVTPRSVDVYVRRLREKVEIDPQHPAYMKTIRGAGYLFETRAS